MDKDKTPSSIQPSAFNVLPGDVCTVLLPWDQGSDSVIATFGFLVNRFWSTAANRSTQLFYQFRCAMENPRDADIECTLASKVTTDPVKLSGEASADRQRPEESSVPTFGTLADGRFYYVYRVLLYCDDFVPRSSMFTKGSVGGCYFLPLSLSLNRRRGRTAVRTIALTPTGVSTNQVLDYIIPDIIQGMTEGFESVDADGTPVTIFIEVVGFIGDYPELSKVTDVMSHAAGKPCTLCIFRHRNLEDSSNYAYSITIHSCHTSFARSLRKTLALRSATLSADDYRLLGMKTGSVSDINEPGRWPLVKLACEIDQNRPSIPRTEFNKPVVSPTFDPYTQNVVAPDHLLAGIGKYLVESVFLSITNNRKRYELDTRMCFELKTLGMGSHSNIFNLKTKSLNKMSMSNVYAIILLLTPHLHSLHFNNSFKLLPVVKLFSNLIALTFWWPTLTVGGPSAVQYVLGVDQSAYHTDMITMASKFVSEIGLLCNESAIIRKRLDKPNIHRVLELYQSTIPNYSHALFTLDMGFEHNHQPLKSSLLRNTNINCHLSAVYQSLGSDWFRRISELLSQIDWSNVSRYTSDELKCSLRRLFFGDCGTELEASPMGDQFRHQMDAHLEKVLHPSFVKLLRRWYSKYQSDWSQGFWVGQKKGRSTKTEALRSRHCSTTILNAALQCSTSSISGAR